MLFEENIEQKLAKSFNIDSLQSDIVHIKKTLKGWTKLFTQIMELQIQSSKQHQQNTILLQQLLHPKKTQNKKSENLNISPIKMAHPKTEADENLIIMDSLFEKNIYSQENLSKILNNQKKMSIINYQGTPFDSAYETINREMQQSDTEKDLDFEMEKFRISQTVHKSANMQQEMVSLPQSAKNADKRQFVFNSNKNLPKYSDLQKQSTQFQKENHSDKNNLIKQDQKKMRLKEHKLSTVVEESSNASPYVTQQKVINQTPTHNIQINSCSNKQTFHGFEFQTNHSRTPTNNATRPINYFIETSSTSNNNRSGSKSLYQNNNNQTQKIQQSQLPFKQQFEIMTQRAKSYSEQNNKQQKPKKAHLDIDLLDKQYENSQELIRKSLNLNKKT